MSRTSDDPVKHVISFRVNDEERVALEDLSIAAGVSISTLMRESIEVLKNQVLKKRQSTGLVRRTSGSVLKS